MITRQTKGEMKGRLFSCYPIGFIEPEDAEVLWILSLPKSATTTFSSVLDLSEDIYSFHEYAPRLWQVENEFYQDKAKSKKWQELVYLSRIDIVSMLNADSKIYAECNPKMSVLGPAVKKVFPKTRFVYILRDMDDFVKSAYNWGLYHENDKQLQWRPKPDVFGDAALKCAWYWVAVNTFLLDFIDSLPKKDVFVVPFSKIKNKDIEYMQFMFEWIGRHVPTIDALYTQMEKKLNSRDHDLHIEERTWWRFDNAATAIYKRAKKYVV